MESNQISDQENNQKKNIFLILVPIFFIVGFLVLIIVNKQKVTDNAVKELTTVDNEAPSPTPLPEEKSTGLGYPVVRVAKHTYKGWNEYKSLKGAFAIYYPSKWFVDESTVFSWDPKSVERPLPLQGKDSKWDMNLVFVDDTQRPTYVAEVFDLHSEPQNYHLFEVTKTIDGWPVYIATVKTDIIDPKGTFGDHDYLRAVIVTPDGILSWAGFAGIESNDGSETLKQIVESLHYSN